MSEDFNPVAEPASQTAPAAPPPELPPEAAELVEKFHALRQQMKRVLIGQDYVLNQVMICMLSGGHALLEGVPGLGKTLLAKGLSRCITAEYARIQFTPDLMPSDVMGHMLFNMQTQEFVVRKGPIFANFVLGDEINRAPAKTQSSMLEVMQEGQVTIEGKAHPVPQPFMVLATQNPLEQEGTYPLPEAQMDRFLLMITLDYPSHEEETDLAKLFLGNEAVSMLNVDAIEAVMTGEELQKAQDLVCKVKVDEAVLDYAVRLVRETRDDAGFSVGAGPRGVLSLLQCARSLALLNRRAYVTPDDIKSLVLPVLRHRVQLSPEMAIEGRSTDELLTHLVERVAAPRA